MVSDGRKNRGPEFSITDSADPVDLYMVALHDEAQNAVDANLVVSNASAIAGEPRGRQLEVVPRLVVDGDRPKTVAEILRTIVLVEDHLEQKARGRKRDLVHAVSLLGQLRNELTARVLTPDSAAGTLKAVEDVVEGRELIVKRREARMFKTCLTVFFLIAAGFAVNNAHLPHTEWLWGSWGAAAFANSVGGLLAMHRNHLDRSGWAEDLDRLKSVRFAIEKLFDDSDDFAGSGVR